MCVNGDINLLSSENKKLLNMAITLYSSCGVSREDLRQYGFIGLLKAKQKYEKKYNVLFKTYAFYWIKREIIKGIYREKGLIKYKSGMVSSITKINELRRFYFNSYGKLPSLDDLSQFSGIKCSLLERTLKHEVVKIYSLSETLNEDGVASEDTPFLENILFDDSQNPEDIFLKKEDIQLVKKAIFSLSDRERKIIIDRINGKSLQEIGDEINRTRERVRQIEEIILDKLAKFFVEEGYEK